jgi:multiple sugar transport system permease protein
MTSPTGLTRSPATPASAPEPRSAPKPPPRGPRSAPRHGPFRVAALLPLIAFIVVFTGYPMVELVRMSLSDVQIRGGDFVSSYAGTVNYREFGSDGLAHHSFLITGLFILVTVPATVGLGTLLAILVHRSTRLAGVARSVLLWPALIAPVVVSVIWWLMLTPNFGALNKVLDSVGAGQQGWLGSSTGAMASIIAVDVWHWTPLVFILIFTAVQGVDATLLDAARVDGATDRQTYRHVVLPLLVPAILVASFIRLTMGAKAFDEMYVLTKGGPEDATTLVSLYVRSVFFDQLKLGYGAAVSILVIVAVIAALGLVALGRVLRPATPGAASA